MPKADALFTTPRRAMLAGIAAMPVLAMMAAPAEACAHPDAALLEVCRQYDALTDKIRAFYEGPNRIEDDRQRMAAIDPYATRQEELLEDLTYLRATTLEGLQARARTLAKWCPDIWTEWTEGMDDMMVLAIVRDLLGGQPA